MAWLGWFLVEYLSSTLGIVHKNDPDYNLDDAEYESNLDFDSCKTANCTECNCLLDGENVFWNVQCVPENTAPLNHL